MVKEDAVSYLGTIEADAEDSTFMVASQVCNKFPSLTVPYLEVNEIRNHINYSEQVKGRIRTLML